MFLFGNLFAPGLPAHPEEPDQQDEDLPAVIGSIGEKQEYRGCRQEGSSDQEASIDVELEPVQPAGIAAVAYLVQSKQEGGDDQDDGTNWCVDHNKSSGFYRAWERPSFFQVFRHPVLDDPADQVIRDGLVQRKLHCALGALIGG
jgi:hypothetical protein